MALHILIVEDEPVIARELYFILEDMGIKGADIAYSYEAAITQMDVTNYDMVLLDINLESKQDGVDLAHHINKTYQTSFLFITSYYEQSTIARAKATEPLAYILKPFNQRDIRINVEIALYKISQTKETSTLYLKGQSGDVSVEVKSILYLEADSNYTRIVTREQAIVTSQLLKKILEQLPVSAFVRTHKSYAVRLDEVTMVKGNFVYLHSHKVPIGRSYKPEFQKRINQ